MNEGTKLCALRKMRLFAAYNVMIASRQPTERVVLIILNSYPKFVQILEVLGFVNGIVVYTGYVA